MEGGMIEVLPEVCWAATCRNSWIPKTKAMEETENWVWTMIRDEKEDLKTVNLQSKNGSEVEKGDWGADFQKIDLTKISVEVKNSNWRETQKFYTEIWKRRFPLGAAGSSVESCRPGINGYDLMSVANNGLDLTVDTLVKSWNFDFLIRYLS